VRFPGSLNWVRGLRAYRAVRKRKTYPQGVLQERISQHSGDAPLWHSLVGGDPLPFLALSKDGGFNSGCPPKLLIRLDAEPTCIGRAGFQFGSPLPIAWTRKLLGKTVFELGISCPPFEM
jgi:hypothetical protein